MVILHSRPLIGRSVSDGQALKTILRAFASRGLLPHKHPLLHEANASLSLVSLNRSLHLARVLLNRKTFRNIYHNFKPEDEYSKPHLVWGGILCAAILSIFIIGWPLDLENAGNAGGDLVFVTALTNQDAGAPPNRTPPSAKSEVVEKSEESVEAAADAGSAKSKRPGFHDRKIIAYENRLRLYSTPDKAFRYFATKKVFNSEHKTWDLFMTPDDFVRSITPDMMQPAGLGLDKAEKFDLEKDKLDFSKGTVTSSLPDDSVFKVIGENCLISFSDYMFLLTLLSTPRRQFEVAFRMFDDNGDGEVDVHEFNLVQESIRAGTATGKKHRDHNTTGSKITHNSSALTTYFFGKEGDKKLTVKDFITFYELLQRDLLKLEFDRWDKNNSSTITEREFADSLVAYAGLSEVKRRKMMKRVKDRFVPEESLEEGEELEPDQMLSKGITFEEYSAFYRFIGDINDVDTALTFYTVAGASIDPGTLQHVARTVTGVTLSTHMLDLIYCMFDENGDGELSNKEFVSVMKQRVTRGLEKSKDTGFTRIMGALIHCGYSMTLSRLGLLSEDTKK